MQTIFKDPRLNNSFLNDGFLVIYNAFDITTLDKLQEIYSNNIPDCNKTFYTTQWIDSPGYKSRISTKISAEINSVLLSFLNNYKSVFSYFMVKHPNDTSFSHAHQDWSIVDEEIYSSINTWLPLTVVTRENGAMRLLPQSHKTFNLPRGSYIENRSFDNQRILSEKDFLTLNLQAGDLLLFDTRLVHASFNNISEKTRVATGNILIPEKASLFHYYKKNNSINKVKLNDDFLFEYSFGQDFITFLNNNYETNL